MAPSATLPPTPRRLHGPLLSWYDADRRDLPWRGQADPYAVWVSEVMLQQTRVDTVVPYFLRWMGRFPDVAALAEADADEVLRRWSGLGYYSRARNLHRAARVVASEHGGRLPRSASALGALPGIGPYTAGAIASIAYGERVPAVDGNVLRVIARLDGDGRDIMAPSTRAAFTKRAAGLVPARRPGDWNQALMELGATVCTPREPDCVRCPVQRTCVANATGRVHELPVRAKRGKPATEERHLAYVEHEGRVLMTRTPGDGLLGGLWALPAADTPDALERTVHAAAGAAVRLGPELGTAQHRFTHRHWAMTVHRADVDGAPGGPVTATGHAGPPMAPGAATGEWRWLPRGALADAAVSTAMRKALAVAWSSRALVDP